MRGVEERPSALVTEEPRIAFDGSAGRRLVAEWRAAREPAGGRPRTRASAMLAIALLSLAAATTPFTDFPVAPLHEPADRGFLPHAAPSSRAASTDPFGESAMRPSRSVALATPVLAAAAAFLTATSNAHAEERRVPEDYPTIQAAIDAAVDGDVVSIAAGEYTSPEIQLDRPIHLLGREGAVATLLRASSATPVIRVLPNVAGQVKIEGFSVLDWTGKSTTAFVLSGGTTTVLSCLFKGCTALAGGSALRVDTPTTVDRCAFFDNRSAIGGAIFATQSLTISDSVFVRNSAVNPSGPDEGGAVHLTGAPATIVRTQFIGNTADIGGAICRWWNNPTVSVDFCRFGGNTSNWNCCIVCTDCGVADPATVDADCDSDGIPDIAMIVLDPSLDADGDGVLDRCGCPADLVTDGSVNGADVAVLLNFWGTDGTGYPGVDLDGDGIVGGTDLATMLGAWGACPE